MRAPRVGIPVTAGRIQIFMFFSLGTITSSVEEVLVRAEGERFLGHSHAATYAIEAVLFLLEPIAVVLEVAGVCQNFAQRQPCGSFEFS